MYPNSAYPGGCSERISKFYLLRFNLSFREFYLFPRENFSALQKIPDLILLTLNATQIKTHLLRISKQV